MTALALHPGTRLALQRTHMDELAVAHAIRDGAIPSGQQYENVWLFAMRITGTGAAYRPAIDEFTYRPAEIYLTDRFLERCAGLPVILKHTKGPMLDTAEYVQRNIGSIFVPYINGDEVWGVAKIFDANAARVMSENQLSTSPAVYFRNPEVNETIDVDGRTVLVEGDPSLLDHLAICEEGVWDKGGEPLGVSLAITGETEMAEEKKEGEGREDASAKLDRLLGHMDAMCARMDAIEESQKRHDAALKDSAKKDETAEEKRALEDADKAKAAEKKDAKEGEGDDAGDEENVRGDAAKKDETAEEKRALEDADKAKAAEKKDASVVGSGGDEKAILAGREDTAKKDEREDEGSDAEDARKRRECEMREREDSARKDSVEISKLRRQLAELSARIPLQLSDDQREAFASAQARADEVASMFGKSAPRAMDGENLLSYRKRLANGFKQHSAAHKGLNLGIVPEAMWDHVEGQIYADATEAAMHPVDLPSGTLREVRKSDRSGRVISTFYGEPRAWLEDFAAPKKRLIGIGARKEYA